DTTRLRLLCVVFFFFFFQAEDGIRDRNVTGVQTCALPILSGDRHVAVTAATSTIAGHLAELLVEQGIRPVGLTRGVSGRRATRRSEERRVGRECNEQ